MIKENGNKMTKGDQNLYDSVRYYMMMGYLSSNGLVYCNGVNDKNQKAWAFTPKGEKITELLKQIQNIIHDYDKENDEVKDVKSKPKGRKI
jgi:predicted transcriptional regulator